MKAHLNFKASKIFKNLKTWETKLVLIEKYFPRKWKRTFNSETLVCRYSNELEQRFSSFTLLLAYYVICDTITCIFKLHLNDEALNKTLKLN